MPRVTKKKRAKREEHVEKHIEECAPEAVDEYKTLFEGDLILPVKQPRFCVKEDMEFHIKIIQRSLSNQIISVTFEISKNIDIFFCFRCECDDEIFKSICSEYNLSIEFSDFVDAILSMFDNHINGKEGTSMFLHLDSSTARLEFYDVLEFRSVIIFALTLEPLSDEQAWIYAQRKFEEVKTGLDRTDKDLTYVIDQVSRKNPNMLEHILPRYRQNKPTDIKLPKTIISPQPPPCEKPLKGKW